MPDKAPTTDVTYKTSLQTWRSVLKPELVCFSLVPVIVGYAFGWFQTGYLPLGTASVMILFFALTSILLFITGDIILIHYRVNGSSVPQDEEKPNKKKEQVSDDAGKLMFLRAALVKGFFVTGILWMLFLWFLISNSAMNMLISVMITIYALLYLILLIKVSRTTGGLPVHEIVSISFWNITGVALGSYVVTAFTFYPDTVHYGVLLVLALICYVIIRYAILSNQVYGKVSIQEEQSVPVKKQTPETETSRWISLDINGRFFMLFPAIIVLYYKVFTFLPVLPYFVCVALVGLVWGIDLVKQVLVTDYRQHENLTRMYRQSKLLYIWICVSAVLGFLLEVVIR